MIHEVYQKYFEKEFWNILEVLYITINCEGVQTIMEVLKLLEKVFNWLKIV